MEQFSALRERIQGATVERSCKKPLRREDIFELHRLLVSHVRDPGEAGRYRRIAVRVSHHVPPTARESTLHGAGHRRLKPGHTSSSHCSMVHKMRIEGADRRRYGPE